MVVQVFLGRYSYIPEGTFLPRKEGSRGRKVQQDVTPPRRFPPSRFHPSRFASIFNPSRFAPHTLVVSPQYHFLPSRFAPILKTILSYIAR